MKRGRAVASIFGVLPRWQIRRKGFVATEWPDARSNHGVNATVRPVTVRAGIGPRTNSTLDQRMGQGHVRWHNEERYHESMQYLTPADVYHGLARELTTCRLVFDKSCPIGLTTHRTSFSR